MNYQKLLATTMAFVTAIVLGTAAASIGAAPVAAGSLCESSVPGVIGTTKTFGFCGAEQSYIVPAGVTKVHVKVIGAHGGNRFNLGGNGGQVDAIVDVTAGGTLYVLVGGTGDLGGFNGGGVGLASDTSGGGSSDIRTVSCSTSCPGAPATATLASRLVVGGGGGGTGPCGTTGGAGGGQANGDGNPGGICLGDTPANAATGGTQSAGGVTGGVEGTGGNATHGGAGGGGLYGGGGHPTLTTRGGAGGSSFGPAGSTFSTTATAAQVQITPYFTTSNAVTSLPSSTNYGESVTFTSTLTTTGTATGTIQFYDGASTLGSPISVGPGNKATFTTTTLTVGSHTIKAVYLGDTGHGGGTAPDFPYSVGQQGTSTGLSSTGSPSALGDNVTFTATVVPNGGSLDGGSVQFYDGVNPMGSPVLVNTGTGQASLTTSTLTPGSHMISATYGGTTNFASSPSSDLAHSVECPPAVTLVTCLQPDARIRRAGGELFGNDIYNQTAANQNVSLKVYAGNKRTVWITVQNDGALAESFTVCQCLSSSIGGFAVDYFKGRTTTNISSAIVSGSFTTPVVNPGGKFTIRARVSVDGTAPRGVLSQFRITTTSNTDNAIKDAVDIFVQRR